MGKYKRPQNCERLYIPKVNPEIWAKLPNHAKKRDIKFANLQDTLITSISAITSSLNDILGNKDSKQTSSKQIASKLIDATALVGHVTKEISYKRRDQIKPFLHKDFKQACSRSNEVDKLLFGSDLATKLQQYKQASKVMQPTSTTNQLPQNNTRYNSYNIQRPFLSQLGRRQYPPRQRSFQAAPQQTQPMMGQKKYSKH